MKSSFEKKKNVKMYKKRYGKKFNRSQQKHNIINKKKYEKQIYKLKIAKQAKKSN